MGDACEVYVNSALAFTTPAVAQTGLSYTADADTTFGMSEYRHGFINLAAGPDQVDLALWETAAGTSGGGAWITAQTATVPVPAAVWHPAPIC